MGLAEYKKKRDFRKTPEPKGEVKKSGSNVFVVQKHDASHLHYDLRLEVDGVLKSWAVPKGPSMNPEVKRLAIETEDHPVSYASFEGVIPEGYGAGTVMIWDNGDYENNSDLPMKKSFEKGHLSFSLKGSKLKGEFTLIKTKRENQWLLIKKDDEYSSEKDILKLKPKSVLSNKTLEEIRKS